MLAPGGLHGSAMLIPQSHADLVECPRIAALTMIMPNGCPQSSVVWCDFDGKFVRVNTMRGERRHKADGFG